MYDLHNNIKVITSRGPAAKTTVAAQAGAAVDRLGYQSVELLFDYGNIVATNATLTAEVQHADNPTAASFAAVDDADLIGLEVDAGIAAAAVRTDGVSKNVIKKVGYRGTKRYVRGTVASTVTAATIVGIHAALGNPIHASVN